MALLESWVDHLFAKLAVRYGAAFLRQWPDADPALVKADWAEVLDGTAGDSIAYALQFLPAAPPNAIAFRDLCRKAPRKELPALPAPEADHEAAGRVLATIRKAIGAGRQLSPAQECVARLRQIELERGRLNSAQRAMLASCERMLAASEATP